MICISGSLIKREIPSEITIPCFDSTPNNSIKEAKEKGTGFLYIPSGLLKKKTNFTGTFLSLSQACPRNHWNITSIALALPDQVYCWKMSDWTSRIFQVIPYTDEENNTLMRFGKVFQQTYTRFLDLQKAEAQAGESKIPARIGKSSCQNDGHAEKR